MGRLSGADLRTMVIGQSTATDEITWRAATWSPSGLSALHGSVHPVPSSPLSLTLSTGSSSIQLHRRRRHLKSRRLCLRAGVGRDRRTMDGRCVPSFAV